MVVDYKTNQKIGGVLPMSIIRQPSLFSIQELYDMEPTQKYDAIISAIDMDAIYFEISKRSRFGAPTKLEFAAMIISLFVRYIERIPTIKDLNKRLHDDIAFKINCGFLVSDDIPSESSYSRLITQLEESNILEEIQEKLVNQAIKEGYIIDETVAIDATHFEPRDQAPPKKKSQSLNLKSVGVNQRRNATNGLKNKLKKKLTCQSTKRRLKTN